MSVNSPLGATQSGAFELRSPGLDARTAPSQSRLGLLGLAGVLATGLLVALSAAGTGNLLPKTVSAGVGRGRPSGFVREPGIDLGGIGLTVVMATMFASYLLAVRSAGRLTPLHGPGRDRGPARADASRAATVLDRRVQLPVLRPDRADLPRQCVPGRTVRALPRSPLQLHRVQVVCRADRLRPAFSPHSAIRWRRSQYRPTCSPTRRSRLSPAWPSSRWSGTARVCAASIQSRRPCSSGLNPLVVVYGVGGGHNDLLMLVPLLAGVVLLLQRRGRLGAARSWSAPGSSSPRGSCCLSRWPAPEGRCSARAGGTC